MALSEKTKSMITFIRNAILSCLLLAWLFSKIDFQKTLDTLKTADLRFVLLAAVFYMLILVVLLIRWYVYIRAFELKIPVKIVVRYFFIGLFGNLFLPSAIGGDLIKIYGLCKNTEQKPKVFASVILDRLSGFAGIVLMAVVSYSFGFRIVNDVSIAISIAVLAGLSLMTGAILFNSRIYKFFGHIFSKFPKVKHKIMEMHDDIAMLKDRKYALVQAVGLSCVAQILLSGVFYYLAIALHQHIGFMSCLIFIPLICVASSLPSLGGLGVREAASVILFAKVGVDKGVSLSISLINFFFMVATGLMGGLIYVATLSSRRVQHH